MSGKNYPVQIDISKEVRQILVMRMGQLGEGSTFDDAIRSYIKGAAKVG